MRSTARRATSRANVICRTTLTCTTSTRTLPPPEDRTAIRPLQRPHRLQMGSLHHVHSLHPRLRRDGRRDRDRVDWSRLEASIGPAYGMDLRDTTCTNCGMCIAVCPVGALTDRHFAPSSMGTRHDRNDLRFLRCRMHPQCRDKQGDRPAGDQSLGAGRQPRATPASRASGATSKSSTPIASFTRVSEKRMVNTTR